MYRQTVAHVYTYFQSPRWTHTTVHHIYADECLKRGCTLHHNVRFEVLQGADKSTYVRRCSYAATPGELRTKINSRGTLTSTARTLEVVRTAREAPPPT